MKTSTPIPPIQWVKLRHMSMHLGIASTSLRILAPVVVKPDTVSNRASTKEGIAPESHIGIVPQRDRTIQLSATIINPSLA